MKKNYLFLLLLGLMWQVNNLQAQALNFDGTNDYVQTTYSGIAGTGNRTIEAWIKTTGNFIPGSGGGVQGVLVDYGTFSTGQRFTFNVLWSNAIRLEVGGNGVSGTIAVNDGNWHHVAAVFSNPGNNVKLYVDGVLDAQGSLTVTANTGTANNVMIGRRVDGVNHFPGTIDEVRIWNYARTQAELQADMNNELCGNSNTGLVAYYKFNQGTPAGNNSTVTTLTDDSGAGNNGTLNGFALSGSSSNWVTGKSLSSGNSTTSSFSVTECDTYTAPSGAVYTSSQTVTDIIPNAAGCDSIMTINLTISNSQAITQNVAVCDSFVSGMGQVYYSSQTIVENYTNAAGCDSTITTNLTINREEATANIEVCDSYTAPNGQVYTSSQVVSDTFTNVHGCDSIVTLNITINKADTTVTINGDDLVSSATNSFFQWINCDANVVIGGANSATFTPSSTGNYAVIINTFDGCTDTSACVNFIMTNTENVLESAVQYFPNPTTGQLNIDLGATYENVQLTVMAMDGKEMSHHFYKNIRQTNLDLNVASGLYFIKIKTGRGSYIFKVMKE